MPLYEYVCHDCHTQFDALVVNRERADEIACEGCTGTNTRRLISTFALSGVDDYALKMAGQVQQQRAGGCCGGSCGCGH